jgi:tetratricopeptide (TPR) repeat protein
MAKPPLNLSQALSRAMSAYNAGQLVEVEQICQQIINTKRDLFDALHLLAVVQSRLGKKDTALASYDRALALRPDSAEALSNRGLTLHKLKRFEEALASFDRALTLRPDFAAALLNRGLTLHELKRFEEALASHDRALAVRPDHAEALCNRGLTLHELKRFEEALASYDRALKARPDYAEALSNRGVTLYTLKRFEEALASHDRAVTVRPDFAEALSNRGLTLHELKRFAEALASYDRALKARPDFAEALCNRGLTLHELKRFAEALASYDRALKARPDYAEALSNRGLTLHELKRFDEALANYDRALTLRPDLAEAHWNEALLRLLTGDFDRGWEKHEWRWETEQQRNEKRNFARPQWTGQQDITSKTILLHAEQGFGDTIQFCRYVPRVVERAERVILEVPKSLHELMSTLAGVAEIVCRGDPLPDFDIHSPLLSLPLAFGTRLESIPSTTPYLQAPTHALQRWQMRLGPRDRLRIGICWAGNANFKGDLNRSIGLPPLLPLLANTDVQFFSLQKDLRAGDAEILRHNRHIIDLSQEIETFSDTAAIISSMDLVISSDTSVAHLAGALGKPVWILLQFVPDWRWLLDREDSPWYPTARLFRQDETRQWDNVIARVHVALHVYVRSL